MSAEYCPDKPRTEAAMPRMLHLRSAVLGPQHGEFARSTWNVPNLPFDLDVPEGRTQCTVFVRVRSKLMKHEVQRACQGRFKLHLRAGCEELSTICGEGTHGLLKQLRKPKHTAIVAREHAKTVKACNPGRQFSPVIFDTRRVRLLDCCFDHHQQVSNSVIEFAEQKSHAVFVQIEFTSLPSHFSLRARCSRNCSLLRQANPGPRFHVSKASPVMRSDRKRANRPYSRPWAARSKVNTPA